MPSKLRIPRMERIDPALTKGRGELVDPRGPIDKDYGRVLHSGAFRRLQGKSQVVHTSHADWFRTRLTHTLEVAQIARDTAKRLPLHDPALSDRDYGPSLVEVGALIHDLGHPPFGHNGENALKTWMESVGSSFEANAQSFRVVTRLEVKYSNTATPVGLNLTLETLAASLKYAWPQDKDENHKAHKKFGYYEDDAAYAQRAIETVLAEVPSPRSERGRARKHAAAEIVDWADDVAYSVHDLEDGIRARLIPIHYIVSPSAKSEQERIIDQAEKAVRSGSWNDVPDVTRADLASALARLCNETGLGAIGKPYQQLDDQRGAMKQITSELIERFTFGLTPRTRKRPLRTAADLKRSPTREAEIEILKAMNWLYVIQSRELQTMQYRERKVVSELADAYLSYGESLLPHELQGQYTGALLEDIKASQNKTLSADAFLKGERNLVRRWDLGPLPELEAYPKLHRARVVCDYVAGMTDRFAERSHARLLGLEPQAVSDYI